LRLPTQLRDAVQSAVANIAAERATDHGGGSAMACAAHLDVMTAMGVIDAERDQRGLGLLERAL
jgi:hypothetical protein